MTASPIKVLVVGDSADDADLMLLELRRAGYAPSAERVETAAGFRSALAGQAWDVILYDDSMPDLDAKGALGLLRESGLDVPLVVVSGATGEERAVELMRAGAADYLTKGRLSRLAPAVEREVRQAAGRKALRQADREARDLAAIVAWSGDAIIRLTLDGTVLTFNGGAERLFGYAAADLAGRSVYTTLVPPEVQDEYREMLGRVGRGEWVEPWESERLRKDGTRIHVSATLSPIRDEAGRVVGASSIARDVTRRKQAEEDARQTSDLLRAVAAATPDAVFVKDRAGKHLLCNEAAARFMNRAVEDVLGRDDAALFDSTDARRIMDWDRRVMESGRPETYEAVLTADGVTRTFHSFKAPYRDAAGNILGVIGISHDITDHKRAEDALRASEDRYRTLLERIPDPLFAYDRETLRYMAVNDAAVATYGYTRDEFLGMTIKDIRPAADVPALLVMLARSPGGFEDRGLWRHRKKDGTVFDVEITAHDIELDGRPACIILARDVTERKRAEESSQRTANLLTAISDGTTDAVFVKDLTGKYLLFNPAAARFVGRPAEDVIGRDDAALFGEADARWVMDRDRRVMQSGDVQTEEEVLTAAGVTRVYQATKAPYRDEHGKVIGLIGVSRDITDQKRVEAERAELLAELNIQIARMPLAYLLSGPDFRYTGWNPAAERTFGFSRAEALGKHPFEVVVPPQSQALVASVFDRLAAGDMNAHGVCENVTKDGRTITCEWYNTPLFGPAGTFLGVLSLAQDVTARRQAEAELHLRDRAIQGLSQGILIADATLPDYPVVYASPGYLRLSGYDDVDVLGQSCQLLYGPKTDPEELARMRRAVAAREGYSGELLCFRKDGTTFWDETHLTPFASDDRVTHYIGVHTDVTGRRKLEEQFRQVQKLEAVGQLAGGVAHDFNNLLTVINGYGEMVYDALPADHPSRELVAEITKAGERAAGLTRQLLAFSRQSMLEPKVLDPNALVRDVERMLRRLIGEDIDLATRLAPDLGQVKADPGQLEQAVVNLCVNARDAMTTGGNLTLETRNVELDAAYVAARPYVRPGPYVVLAVSDTGTGMTPEVQARIFEPFFTTKERGKGTGLGLAMVFGFVKQSGGYVEVYSEVGRGTAFKLYLPRVGEAPSAVQSGVQRMPMPRGTETVLLVEDEDTVRALGRHVLGMCGYTVLEAGDGREAVRIADEHTGPLHILVTDVVMPGGMGGRQVADAVVARHPGIKVLFTSGYTDDAVVRHGVLEEGTHFLQKPFSPAAFAVKVRDVLDAHGDSSQVHGS